MAGLVVTASTDTDRLEVSLIGELDMATVPQVADVVDPLLAQQRPATLVFDCADLAFVDSSGLGLWVSYRNDGLEAGFDVVTDNVNARIRRLLAVTHLDELLTVTPDSVAESP